MSFSNFSALWGNCFLDKRLTCRGPWLMVLHCERICRSCWEILDIFLLSRFGSFPAVTFSYYLRKHLFRRCFGFDEHKLQVDSLFTYIVNLVMRRLFFFMQLDFRVDSRLAVIKGRINVKIVFLRSSYNCLFEIDTRNFSCIRKHMHLLLVLKNQCHVCSSWRNIWTVLEIVFIGRSGTWKSLSSFAWTRK